MISKAEISRQLNVDYTTVYRWEKAEKLKEECLERGLNIDTGEIATQATQIPKADLSSPKGLPGPSDVDFSKLPGGDNSFRMTPELKKAQKRIEEMFGEGSFRFMDEKEETEMLPTGFKKLDDAIGGGMPKGKIIEFYGYNGTGKSTLAIQIAAYFQKSKKRIAYIDFENALDRKYSERLGLSLAETAFFEPKGQEEGMEILRTLCEEGASDLIIVDSVAAMSPTKEREGEVGDSNMGIHAKILNQVLRMIAPDCNQKGVTVIFINQIRSSYDMFGAKEKTYGGFALGYWSSLRIQFKVESTKDKTEKRDAILIPVKSRQADPYVECKLELIYGEGFKN